MRPLVEKNRNRLIVDLDGQKLIMHADVTRLRQILFNLLSNATKFTHDGTLTLRVRRKGERIHFDVQDSGIGMTEEQMGRLFQAFSQADASTTRKYGGTGLGLALSRQFAQMMGGDIEVSSAVGEGSTFSVSLPLHTQTLQSSLMPPEPATARGDILVIDDDPDVRGMLARFLLREGYAARAADGGQRGLAEARARRPDAILLDILMPEPDGWTVLTELQDDPELRDVPVVLVTMADDREKGYALGATEFLKKPVDLARLRAVLGRHVAEGSTHHVLVVDDDPAIREHLRRALDREGWSVCEARDGREALALVEEEAPSAIVLDLMMPEVDGFEVLDELRSQKAHADIPVIVFTAMDLSSAQRERLEGSVQRVLEKGARSREAVLREIRRILGGKPSPTVAPPPMRDSTPSRDSAPTPP